MVSQSRKGASMNSKIFLSMFYVIFILLFNSCETMNKETKQFFKKAVHHFLSETAKETQRIETICSSITPC